MEMIEIEKITIIEIKNTFQGLISRFNMAKNSINKFGHRPACISQPETQREGRLKQTKPEQNLQEPWNNKNKYNIICNENTRS